MPRFLYAEYGGISEKDAPIEGVLIDNGDKKIAVLVNPNESGMQTEIEIDGTLYYIEMHADSVATIILGE